MVETALGIVGPTSEDGGRELTASSRVPSMGVRQFVVFGAGAIDADSALQCEHEGSWGTLKWDRWRRGIEGSGLPRLLSPSLAFIRFSKMVMDKKRP